MASKAYLRLIFGLEYTAPKILYNTTSKKYLLIDINHLYNYDRIIHYGVTLMMQNDEVHREVDTDLQDAWKQLPEHLKVVFKNTKAFSEALAPLTPKDALYYLSPTNRDERLGTTSVLDCLHILFTLNSIQTPYPIINLHKDQFVIAFSKAIKNKHMKIEVKTSLITLATKLKSVITPLDKKNKNPEFSTIAECSQSLFKDIEKLHNSGPHTVGQDVLGALVCIGIVIGLFAFVIAINYFTTLMSAVILSILLSYTLNVLIPLFAIGLATVFLATGSPSSFKPKHTALKNAQMITNEIAKIHNEETEDEESIDDNYIKAHP